MYIAMYLYVYIEYLYYYLCTYVCMYMFRFQPSEEDEGDDADEEVVIPFPNLLEVMGYFQQGGVSASLGGVKRDGGRREWSEGKQGGGEDGVRGMKWV